MEAGAILVKRGLLSSQQLDQLRRDRPEATRLDHAAVEMGLVNEDAALRALGDEVGMPFVDLDEFDDRPVAAAGLSAQADPSPCRCSRSIATTARWSSPRATRSTSTRWTN